ncbi:MAG: tetratricopeptide repeat protein, partial [Pseudomonadota bacterium]
MNCLTHGTANAQDALSEWDRLTKETVTLVNQGNLPLAEEKARETLSFSEQALPDPSLELATAHNNLGSILSFQEKYAESEKHHRAALALRRQILSADDPLITTSLENLADVFRRMAKYGDAV